MESCESRVGAGAEVTSFLNSRKSEKKSSFVVAFTAIAFAIFAAGGGLIVLAIWLTIPVAKMASQSRDRQACQNNLRAIGIAIQRYHDANGHFPPPFIVDENGKPKHSWRVLLLPYLGEQALFSQYDLSESWDSPRNLIVAQSMPSVFACPADSTTKTLKETNYLVLVGSRTLFPTERQVTRADLRDGLSQTIMVVETTGAGIGWTEPVDLDAKSFSFLINTGTPPQLGSLHTRGINVLMADGNVYFLDEATSPDLLEAQSTISGGEVMPLDRLLPM